MSAEKLLPCAHCGAVPNLFRERNEFWRVVCHGCDMRTGAVYPPDAAVTTWNRRTPDLRALITEAVKMARYNKGTKEEISLYITPSPYDFEPKYTTAEIVEKLLRDENGK